MLEIKNADLRLRCIPEIGGTVVDFSGRFGDRWLPLMRPGQDPLTRSSLGSSFFLAPYSNRLKDAVFSFRGKEYRLQNPEKHANHGDVRDRPWKVEEANDQQIRMSLDSTSFSDFNFPFPFSVAASYRIEDRSLSTRLRLRNIGDEPMPAGCGFHPYFPRSLDGVGDEVQLELEVEGVYPGDTPIPTGPPEPVPAWMSFKERRPLDVELDHCFSGWTRRAVMVWPKTGAKLTMQASAALGHVILYSPPGESFFAVEPVSNANNGFNLFDQGICDAGVVILEPGQELEGEFSLTLG